MTIQVTSTVFENIDGEHRDLERQYAAFDLLLDSETLRINILRKRLKELAAVLRSHFEREEEQGYFAEITQLAPRLSHCAQALEEEHDALLMRLVQLDDQLAATADVESEVAELRQEFTQFIKACRSHEHRETALVQEAWLTEIGTGD